MAKTVIDLNSSSTNSVLNQTLIDQLKEKEYKNTIKQYDDKLEAILSTMEFNSQVEASVSKFASVSELLTSTNITNVFDDYKVSQNGDNVTFDTNNLDIDDPINVNVDVTSLAKRNVWQSNTFTSSSDLLSTNAGDTIVFVQGGTTYTVDANRSWKDVQEDINTNTNGKLQAKIEKVGNGAFRLIIQSADTGASNSISISTSPATMTAFNANEVQAATDFNATVDGVSYSFDKNELTLSNGLKINALQTGTTTAHIAPDNTTISKALNDFVDAFNDVNANLDKQIDSLDYAKRRPLDRLQADLKEMLFTTIDSKAIFSYGFSLDEYGKLGFDEKKYNALSNTQQQELKKIFLGDGANEGLGKKADDLIDSLYENDGILKDFNKDILDAKIALEKEQKQAQAKLDEKYDLLAQRFSKYNAIIAKLELSLQTLELLTKQSNEQQ